MGKDIDWKETEWLVTQLRAKLAEDQQSEVKAAEEGKNSSVGAPTRPEPYTYGRKKKKKTHTKLESVPAVEADVPVSEEMHAAPAFAVEEVAEKPIAEVASEPEESTDVETEPVLAESEEKRDDISPKEEEPVASLGVFEEDPVAEEMADGSAQNTELAKETVEYTQEGETVPAVTEPLPVYRRAVPPQRRTALFAVSHEREPSTEYNAAAHSERKPLRGKKATSAPKVRTEKEMQAEVTVENLMQDLFGAESLGWFSDDQSVTASVQEPPVAPQPSTEVSVPASKKASRKSAVAKEPKQDFETITREMDGQMALVLPETGKPLAIPAGEREQRSRREERKGSAADDAQIDLFSTAGGSAALSLDPKQEKSEFKRSIEASDEDFQLLLDLDYEDELGTAIGFEKIRAYHEEGVNGQPVVKHRRRNAERREYEVQSQDTALRKNYTKQKSEHVVRLALSVFFTLLIMIYEQSGWMAALFGGMLDGNEYPASYILMGIQLLVLVAFFSYSRLWEGFLRILKFSPIDYSLCSIMLIATLIYHVVLIFLPHEGAPALYLSPAAMSLVLLALADLLDWYRESLAFQVISSRKQKYALIPRVSVGGRQGNARYSLTDDDAAGTVWYVRPVGFVRNYFANTEKRVGHGRALGVQLLLILGIGLAFGWYALAAGGTAVQMVQTLFVTFLLCVPVTSLLVTSLPMFLGACLRLGKKGAIIGEEPVYRCGGTTTLVVPDSEVFGAMHHEQFEVVEEEYYDQITVLVRALLEKLQSPLCDSVNVERDRRIPPSKVTLTEIEHDGVAAHVDDEQISMLIGSVDYLESNGITVSSRVGTDAEYGGKRLVCVAAGGRLVAFFLARYRLNNDMSELLRETEGENVKIMIRTKDPGIRNDLFESLLPDRHDPVLAMKPTAREIDLRTDRVDATVVALGSCREASRTFVTCRRVRRAANFGKLFQGLSMVVGGVIAALLTILGGSVGMSSFLVSIYLLFWCGTHAVTSYFFLRERNDE